MSAVIALNEDALPGLSAQTVDGVAIETPRYERRFSKRICHIGIGRFHRAHQAVYLHKLLQAGLGDGWGLCEIAMRRDDSATLAALHAQQGLYSVWELEGRQRRVSIVGSIMQLVDASTQRQPAIEAIADAATRIVSLTITEAGYCLAPGGGLNLSHPDIAHDLAQVDNPRSAPALLVRALAARRARGNGGVTLLSCDNLLENGHQLRAAVLGFAQQIDADLAAWIARECRFPCSMVDRITPAPTAERLAAAMTGAPFADAASILCEPWLQWVIEDDFANGRPAFEQAGATLSAAVKDWENMKVGLLNGAHSALSHAGLMLGYVTVHEAASDALLARWLAAYSAEVAATLQPIAGVGFAQYQAALLRRFKNPAIEDRLTRLAQDTSAKFQQTLLPPAAKRLQQHGQSPRWLAAAAALWLRYLDGLRADEAARAAYLDGGKDRLIEGAAAAVAAGDAGEFLCTVWPAPVELVPAVNEQLRQLTAQGLKAWLSALPNPA